jgi:prepilin-type N-terminal cleavage/methylation domain-containing protein
VESAYKQTFTRSARRGLTFIETICAVALLALVAAAVMGAFNSIITQQERERHRLGAMELCNRLILQYLDDSDTMPAAGLPIVYGDERYHWELSEVPVQLIPARPDVAEDRSSASAISVNRMHAINVTVWLSDESGGSAQFDGRVPSATLTRLMDPIALRNPDTTNTLVTNSNKQQQFIARFRAIGRNAPAIKPAPGTTGDTKPTPPPVPSKPNPMVKPTNPNPSKFGDFGVNPNGMPPSKPPPKGPKS